MPVPFPEVFTKKVNSEEDWEKKLVSLQVIILSWLCLGGPRGAPCSLSLGERLSAEQWSVVSYLRHLNRDGNTPNEVDSMMMGRAAAKFESIEVALSSLHRGIAFLHDSFRDSSFGPLDHSRPAEFDDSWMRCGSIVGHFEGEVLSTAKPIIADRLGFPGAPSFDPVPYFDQATAEVFLRPLDHAASPESFEGEVPRVKINASQKEKIALFKKLSLCGRLKPVMGNKVRGRFVSGLFSVGKNALVDRLILDARPPNLLEASKTFWCGSMAAGSCIGDLVLHPDQALLASGLDLKDYFYQFIISEQRVERNILSGCISLVEAREIFGHDFEWPEKKIHVALSTLAMGDLLACEFAQSAHLGMLLDFGAISTKQLITMKTPLPRSFSLVGIVIDDMIVLEKVALTLLEELTSQGTRIPSEAAQALAAYEANHLEANSKKSFFSEIFSSFWGIQVDGKKGLARASATRLWPLIAISCRVSMLGFATVKLVEVLAGCWIAVLTMRRRMLCLMDVIFEPLGIDDDSAVIRLSPALQDELLSLSVLGPLAAADLRAEFRPYVSATDASGDWMAGVRAPLACCAVEELARFSLKKSTWTRLLPPNKAYLRETQRLPADQELPEFQYVSHPIWQVLAGALQYREKWRLPSRQGKHINVQELHAFIIEEKHAARECKQKRILSGIDSQVTLGSLIKGRSSSPALNSLLRSNLCHPLGSGIFHSYMYFLSEENRADGPTRHKAPAAPDIEYPQWLVDLENGDYAGFDEFLCKLPREFQLQPFPFENLVNGKDLDIRPTSRLKQKEKVVEKSSLGKEARCAPEVFFACPNPVDPATWDYMKKFNKDQFFCSGEIDFSQPGALDLFSGSFGVARQMIKAGAPWVLTFDWLRASSENLLDEDLRGTLTKLIMGGWFKSIGMAPICASFSPAVTPAVRSARRPRGLPGISPTMREKVAQGNSHADFCIFLIGLCLQFGIAYFIENPDRSWLWKLRTYKKYASPSSEDTFRLSYCRFGTPWQKNTRIGTSTRLAGLRMLCQCRQAHLPLRGYSSFHKTSWTKVAEPYPRGVARLLATALCAQAGWCDNRKLNISGCCRCGSLRVGEATNPGPARGFQRGSLEELPGISAETLALESRLLQEFLTWCNASLTHRSAEDIFAVVPQFAAQTLRSYGDLWFQQGKSLSNFRHLVISVQRWRPELKPFLFPAWELIRRWELQEPVSHRPPLPEGIVKAFVVAGWNFGWYDWCGITLLSFYGFGRLGEVIRCRRFDLILPGDTFDEEHPAVYLQLRFFKSLFRQGSRVQHMKIRDPTAVKLISVIFGELSSDQRLFEGTADQYRRRWNFLLQIFNIPSSLRLTPGGLRGGAAVRAYREGMPISQILWLMRLRNITTLEFYLQEVGSLTILSKLPTSSRESLRRIACLYIVLPSSLTSR